MPRRDPDRLRKLRTAIRYLLREDVMGRGHQSRLAEHFDVSRQRVHQLVNEEQQRRARVATVAADGWLPVPPSAPPLRPGPPLEQPRA